LVERVTFYNEETGFAVLRVNVKGYRELVPVVGALASVNAGEWITAQGNWVQDREHGRQFKATFLKASPPTSKEGIEKYLASKTGLRTVVIDRDREEKADLMKDLIAIIYSFSARIRGAAVKRRSSPGRFCAQSLPSHA
jgi:hypothetical protein